MKMTWKENCDPSNTTTPFYVSNFIQNSNEIFVKDLRVILQVLKENGYLLN